MFDVETYGFFKYISVILFFYILERRNIENGLSYESKVDFI